MLIKKIIPVFLLLIISLCAYTQPIKSSNGKIVLANAETTTSISSNPADTILPYNWGFNAEANITLGKSIMSGNFYYLRLNSFNLITDKGYYYKQKYDKKYPGKYYPCSMLGNYCNTASPSQINVVTIWEYQGRIYKSGTYLTSYNGIYVGVNTDLQFPRNNGEIPSDALKSGSIKLKEVKLGYVPVKDTDAIISIIRGNK